jgi:hypothetical protein
MASFRTVVAGIVVLFCSVGVYAADSSAEQKLFHDIYKELVEINTTHSVGAKPTRNSVLRSAPFALPYVEKGTRKAKILVLKREHA